MTKMIGFCGIDCEKCDAYIATKTNNHALRASTAKLWAQLNNAPILPEHINCDGCRVDGKKTIFCENICAIRKCAMTKNFASCKTCSEISVCPRIADILANNAEAKKNLGIKPPNYK